MNNAYTPDFSARYSPSASGKVMDREVREEFINPDGSHTVESLKVLKTTTPGHTISSKCAPKCPPKPVCQPKCEDPCAPKKAHAVWGWLAVLVLYFIVLLLLFWVIFFSLRPSFVLRTDSNEIDTGKVLLAAVIAAFIVIVIIWVIKICVTGSV